MKHHRLDNLLDGYYVDIYSDREDTYAEIDTDGPVIISLDKVQKLLNAMIQLERE